MAYNVPIVVQRAQCPVVGISLVTTVKAAAEQHTVKEAEAMLLKRSAEVLNRTGSARVLIQIYPQDVMFNDEVPYTHIVGFPVEALREIPKGMVGHIIPAGEYVRVTHSGPESELPETYDYIYRQWLATSGYGSAGYDFELWDDRYQPEQADNEIELYVALQTAPIAS
ncbi:MAG: AraC family transcriptional regulator [Anaerolineaceae bacterium]|nr:AraC family transcriptional regulator [Anaerolineaceae bacterium]